MLLGFEELCRKEVIDISTGERLGFIDDIELDIESGTVKSLIIYGGARLFGFFGREEDSVIACSEIKVIGSDVVLVERPKDSLHMKSTKKSGNSFLSLWK
ncbi:YlmC/YmxH family sporulation protein [uncultured Ruminococcus sp.]|uniref:YlmC/YmxH family sporulation protein n=1 Tax=uncultured Ruminococcus sp. TaxID=165186 RepID=UPI0025D0F6A0|nr:YlmC/YmxH family sporulation protein [uncultured Ruminococcus sp.]